MTEEIYPFGWVVPEIVSHKMHKALLEVWLYSHWHEAVFRMKM